MSKRDGWCIWSPFQGWITQTFAATRRESIARFESDVLPGWRRFRRQGFSCRPVMLTPMDKQENSHD